MEEYIGDPVKRRGQLLSVCMIVKNEADKLPLILGDIRGVADEIIVVDTGSTDGTREIARSAGARVFEFPWCDDFSAARNYSLDQATGDMVLWLDADDRISPEAREALKSQKSRLERKIYLCLVKNTYGSAFLQIRIFPNDQRLRFKGRVHEAIFDMHGYEQVLFDSLSAALHQAFVITHTGYEHSEVRQAKLLRNLDLLEKSEKNYHVCFYLGKTYDALGKRAKALKHYIRAIKALEKVNVQPDMLYASIVGACKCLLDAGKTKACEAMARRAIDMRPYDVRGWYYWGKSSSDLEAYARGLECRNYLSSMQTHHEWYHVRCLIERNLIKQGVRG